MYYLHDMRPVELRSRIIELSKQAGFEEPRMARAEYMVPEDQRLREWLEQGRHGEMHYLEGHFEKRVDPTKLVPGAQTVICLAYNYYTSKFQQKEDAPKVSMYAFGRDYHKVLKKKMRHILRILSEEDPTIEGRCFVDSAPVLERDWAKRSGLGWVGKNTLLIHPRRGSYFFLGEIIINKELPVDDPISDYCGTCTKCIEACPTDAIDEKGYVMDGSRCISYLTIELKTEIPQEFEGKMEDYIYGCDICQEVCPWNRFSEEHSEPDFVPDERLMNMDRQDWLGLDKESFDKLFRGSAVKRTKYEGLRRNIDFLRTGSDEGQD